LKTFEILFLRMRHQPIYVEINIRSAMADLWRLTQTPELHEQWDLRFSGIEYLPRPDENEPQRFLYTTRIGFGLKICGEGESVGSHNKTNGERTSALKFGSNDPKSLIREGSGYWQYLPSNDGIKFLTWYDYKTRFGWPGQLFDRFIFRPLLGWATAWSFDRLRLWLEKGIAPDAALRQSLIYSAARLTLAFIWLYQGIFPKLLFKDRGELELVRGSGLFSGYEAFVLSGLGWAEIVFGMLFLLLWRQPRLFIWNILLLLILTGGALIGQPGIFVAPFNPTTLNVAMLSLSLIGLWSAKDLPSAANCRRKPG
jgi:hypothetical protein